MQNLKAKILAAVSDDLAAVEKALSENLAPHFDLVGRVAGHLLFAGGKRLRPLLMILSARLCDGARPAQADTAVIFEYLHAATLLHDDVVDGARMRRGRTTAHHIWDQPTAVLTGDFLLARSLSLAARTRMPEVIDAIAAITEYMSQGEIQQLARKADLCLGEAEYLEIIRCKTAVLFEGACRVGALVSHAPAPLVHSMGLYGHHLGLAFQMADDLLDYTTSSESLGKKVGADLREGKLTLPLIVGLSQAAPADRQWMEGLVRKGDFSEDEFRRLIDLLQACGGIDYTRRAAREQIDRAKDQLAFFEASAARDTLEAIADYALVRKA